MSQSMLAKILTTLLEPKPLIILLTILVAVLLPLFLHITLYRASSTITLPSFLLVGPSGSGKTTLLTLLETGQVGSTCTSQTPLCIQISLPAEVKAASSKYRAADDPSLQVQNNLWLVDTPGHAKLRYHALDRMANLHSLTGIIFVVDSASLSHQNGGLREAAEYLHDALLLLQKRLTMSKTLKALKGISVLVAAHKADLFTALPPALVKNALEVEISRIRDSRARGLLDSGTGSDEFNAGSEKEWLGEGGERNFEFVQMKEFNIEVKIEAGSSTRDNTASAGIYWEWIGSNL